MDTDLAGIVLARHDRWSPLERWLAVRALPLDALLQVTQGLPHAQVQRLAGEPLPQAATLRARGWPGPARLGQLLDAVDAPATAGLSPAGASVLVDAEAGRREHGLALPLFTAPEVARRVLARLQGAEAQALAPGCLAAVRRPLAMGPKPPRRLLELVVLPVVGAPAKVPMHRLAEAARASGRLHGAPRGACPTTRMVG